MPKLYVVAALIQSLVLVSAAQAQASNPPSVQPTSPANTPSTQLTDGTRIQDFPNLVKQIYPGVTSVREQSFAPMESGGTSLLGLVARLLGEHPNREHEGLSTKRFLYHVFENDKKVGIAHGSSIDVANDVISVYMFYGPDGTVKDLRVQGLPPTIEKSLKEGNYLSQFIGHSTDDFEVTIGKKGRIKARGAFHADARRPGNAEARNYFDKIFRAVRFNASFMDVAYFITQHDISAEESTVATVEATSGPEAFVKQRSSASNGGPAFENKPILQTLEGPSAPRNSVPVAPPENSKPGS